MLTEYLNTTLDNASILRIPAHELHAHRTYLRSKAEPIAITTHMANTHRGNVNGILRELNVPRQYWEAVIYLNDIDPTLRFNEGIVLIPDYQLLVTMLLSGNSSLPESTSLF
jgi:hypothetical protein